jgi:hypothetical protein
MLVESGEIDAWIVFRWPGSRVSSASVSMPLTYLVSVHVEFSVESEDMRGEGLLPGVGRPNAFAGALSTSFVRSESGECILKDSAARPEDESEGVLPESR